MLGRKRKVAPSGAEHQFLWHLLLSEIDGILATVMHRKNMLEIELLQFGHNLAEIIRGCGRQMETAGKRVNLFDTGDLLRSYSTNGGKSGRGPD